MSARQPEVFEFRFRGGRLCLNFAATLGKRYRGGIERLHSPAELARWLRIALNLEGPMPDFDAVLPAAWELREAIHRLVHPVTRERPSRADVDTLNHWAAKTDLAPMLNTDARSAPPRQCPTAEAALSTIARDAIDLLTGPWLEGVRECDAPDCSLMFVDTSRTASRRWCDMKGCGNRAKARAYRSAHRSAIRR